MDLSAEERKQLVATFGCEETDLDQKIQRYAEAAKEEYLRMVLGQRVFTRGQDVREYRLYLLIKHVYEGQLPSEREISLLFQTTTTQSRALLRAVMSKYQYELQTAISKTLEQTLKSATQDSDTQMWSVTVDSGNIIEALNRRLAAIDGTLPQVVRARNTVTTYEMPNSAYQALTQQ